MGVHVNSSVDSRPVSAAASGPVLYANQPRVQSSQPASIFPPRDATPLTPQQKKQLIDAAEKSVVMLTAKWVGQTGIGSGVIIGEKDGYWIIATARHNTVQPFRSRNNHYVSVQLGPGSSLLTQAYPVPLAGGQQFSDFAFVAIRKDFLPGKVPVPLATELPASGTQPGIIGKELLQAGYPGTQKGFRIGDSEPLQNRGLRGKWVQLTEVRPNSVDPAKVPAGPLLPFDEGNNIGTSNGQGPGVSGGPILGIGPDAQPKVYGVISSNYMPGSGGPGDWNYGQGGAKTLASIHPATMSLYIGADFIRSALPGFINDMPRFLREQ